MTAPSASIVPVSSSLSESPLSCLIGGAGGRPLEVNVHITPSDEVQELRARAADLQERLDSLQADYNRIEYYYRCESLVNMELIDLCRKHGVEVRPSIFHRPKYGGVE